MKAACADGSARWDSTVCLPRTVVALEYLARRVVSSYDTYHRDLPWMSQEPTARPVKSLRCVMCGSSAQIEVPSKFECSNCGRVNQIGVAADRVKGPIVWLAGDSKTLD